jgi:transcription initiation factor TFIIIB Brf1 subunit/transcription initiation factor TFIIB
MVSDLCPTANSHLVSGTGANKINKWSKITYSDRKILDLKKINETITNGLFSQAIMDDIIRITKIARKESKSVKEMDIPFLAASAYYSCVVRSPKTPDVIREIYGLTSKESIISFQNAMNKVELILQRGDYIISLKEQSLDTSEVNLAIDIAKKLNYPQHTIDAIVAILKKFSEKEILQNVIIKNKVAIIVYYVGKYSNLPVSQLDVVSHIGTKSTATLMKYHSYIFQNHHAGVMKYIAKYGGAALPHTPLAGPRVGKEKIEGKEKVVEKEKMAIEPVVVQNRVQCKK